MMCIPLPENVDYDEGSMLFVNPLTCLGLVEEAEKRKCKVVVQTAAFSQLGKMIIRQCKKKGITLINVVRKEEQVNILKEEYG